MAISELPVYKRQQFLLGFIGGVGSCSATDLQKLVFLYTKSKLLDFYCFIPYRYGSYSYQLAEDIKILESKGFITTEPIKQKSSVSFVLPNIDAQAIERLRGRQLIRKVYLEYPYYAINSTIANGILTANEFARVQNQRDKLCKDETMLFTIGYEGKSIENFVNQLIHHSVKVLCDVRNNPKSRKLGFSKDRLKHIVESVGIAYIHIPELGIVSEQRKDLNDETDYRELFAAYRQTLPAKQEYLDVVQSLIKGEKRVALMCFEKNPEYCHRHIIRDNLILNNNFVCEDL